MRLLGDEVMIPVVLLSQIGLRFWFLSIPWLGMQSHWQDLTSSLRSCLHPQVVQAATLGWDFIEGYNRGARPKIIVATMPHCAYCDRLKSETLSAPEVAALLRRFDVEVVDKSQNPERLKRYAIAIYPSIVVLSGKGAPVGKISGFVPRERLCRALEALLETGT